MVKKKVMTILLALSLTSGLQVNSTVFAQTNASIKYSTHVQNIGWQSYFGDGQTAGTTGQALRLEGIKIDLENVPEGMKIKYQTHVQNIGWQPWKYENELSGTTGQSLRLEGIKIQLENAPEGYHVLYQAHVQNIGWQNWVSDGALSGTTGQALRLEALRIRIVNDADQTSTSQTNTAGLTTDVYNNYNMTLDDMVNFQMGVDPKQFQLNYPGYWAPAAREQVAYYVDPNNFLYSAGKYQFLNLNYQEGITADDINNLLKGKGILAGTGQAFLDASKANNISPIYLVSHALLETVGGSSSLANGIVVNGVTVYNLFGINAYDSDPNGLGAQYSYSAGWTTVDKAISGGAAWISSRYINNTTYRQNTIYEMRWNPNKPGTHQYATDVQWADGQVANMKTLADKLPNAKLTFEIPVYK